MARPSPPGLRAAVHDDLRPGGNATRRIRGAHGAPFDIRWNADGTRIASVGDDGAPAPSRRRDRSSDRRGCRARGRVGRCSTGVLTPMIATGGYDGTVIVWRVDVGDLVEIDRFKVQDFAGGMAGLAFSPDGSRLAAGGVDISSTKILDLRPTAGGEIAAVLADHEGGADVRTRAR